MPSPIITTVPGAEVFHWRDKAPSPGPGVTTAPVYSNGDTRVVLMRFAPGAELATHTTSRHALVQILEGTCAFTLGDRVHTLGPGDCVAMPPGAPHALRAPDAAFAMTLTLFGASR